MSVVDPIIEGDPLSIDSTEDKLIPGDLSNLTGYRSSSMLTRYFCTTCSAHMFFRTNIQDDGSSPKWTVMWGAMERTDGIIKVEQHIYVGDTLDGGIADHFPGKGGKHFPRVKGWNEEELLPLGWKAEEGGYKNPETLPFYCHCRKANFYLTRAKPSNNPYNYWLIPGRRPSDPLRFITAHCLCNSCRLCSGGQIQTWTIVSFENVIDPETNSPIDLINPDKRPKSLKQYISNDGRHRESCGTCGATVFWWRDMEEGETPHLDIATALISEVAAGGARAESWFYWNPVLIFNQFALSKETVRILWDGIMASRG